MTTGKARHAEGIARIKRITDRLEFKSPTITETGQSVRYSASILADDKEATFTIIFPIYTFMCDENRYTIQFNGKESQRLNKKYDLRDIVTKSVEEAINPPEPAMPSLADLLGHISRVRRAKIETDVQKRRKANKAAKKARKKNRKKR